jgi:hypothetical protein
MRKFVLLFLSFFIFSSAILTQTIIENLEKPLSKNAGRVLKLEEIFRINDIGADFYFKRPLKLKIASDGIIFIVDEEQLLKFSADGKFIKNLYKKGEGPGEIARYFHFSLYKDDIYIYDFARKIIHTDRDGNLIKEFPSKSERHRDFLGVTDSKLIFMKYHFPVKVKKSKLYDIEHTLVLVSKDGETEKETQVFAVKTFLAPRARSFWAYRYSTLSDDRRYLFVSHTMEYLIKILDLEKGEVTRIFNRKYRRIKYVKEWMKEFLKRHNAPGKKYKDDILGLFICKDHLWVKTSTKDKNKGILIDVFNKEGRFIDSFFLNLKGSLVAIHEDFIFVKEQDEDGNISFVKYRIVE